MALEITARREGDILEIQVTGTFSGQDFEQLATECEPTSQRRVSRCLMVVFRGFSGLDLAEVQSESPAQRGALADLERLALVGERPWEAWMTRFCQLFPSSATRYFTPDRTQEARRWLEVR